MKKALLVISSLLVLGFSAMAQGEFTPSWNIAIKGGVAHTIGEAPFAKLISPNAALDFGYQFTPVFGLRADLSGYEAKGANESIYSFNHGQIALDATFDLCNLFGGYKVRAVNPYIFAGIGANYRFNNGGLNYKAEFPAANYLWDGGTIGLAGRAGAGIDFRLSDAVSLLLEFGENIYSDKFNSKKGDTFDHQMAGLVGIKFNLGAKKRAAAAAAAAEAAAAKLAAEKAAAEKAAAEAEAARLAAEKAAAEKAAAEKAAAEKAAAEKAAAEAAARAAARATNENVLFVIGKYDIRKAEQAKIDNIVKIMNEYPEAVVTVKGYADKATGSAKTNMTLSKKRAEVVADALQKAGIDASRITTEYYGSEVNPFSTAAANRVAVCVTK